MDKRFFRQFMDRSNFSVAMQTLIELNIDIVMRSMLVNQPISGSDLMGFGENCSFRVPFQP